jgi:hypothetical protein
MKQEIYRLVENGELKKAADLIRSCMDSGEDLGGMNVFSAHVIFQAADWDGVTRNLPPETNFFATSGLINSLRRGRPLNAQDEPIPWFTYPAIDFLDSVVRPDWTVFEWGSGNSTLWWAARTAHVVSVEDDAAWYAEVVKQVRPNSRSLFKQGRDYFEALRAYPDAAFDVIVIDGSSRNDCALVAPDKLKPGGLIVFDNADSQEFDAGQQFLIDQGYYRIDFWGPIPSYLYKNCTSVFFKDPALLRRTAVPSVHRSSVGISCFQAMNRRAAPPEI